MDKELLRIVIIAIGVTVIVIMILWSFLKNRKPRRGIDFYDKGNPLENIDPSLVVNTDNDDFDIVSIGSAVDKLSPDPITQASEEAYQQESQQPQDKKIPELIQFSIVAATDEGFNGLELVNAFNQVGLEYGSMQVFERIDDRRRVDFAVASMVEPGTFPETNLESFNSPGIVFFIQPIELEHPLAIFDNFIQSINLIAEQLNGIKLDHNRQPLTEQTIQQFRLLML
jgi:cell division protein ZipA